MGRTTNAFLNISDWTERIKLVSWHIPIHYVTFFTILDLQCFLLLKQVLELRTWRYHMLCFSLYHYLIDPDENTQKCSCLSLYSFNSLKSLNSFGDNIIKLNIYERKLDSHLWVYVLGSQKTQTQKQYGKNNVSFAEIRRRQISYVLKGTHKKFSKALFNKCSSSCICWYMILHKPLDDSFIYDHLIPTQ